MDRSWLRTLAVATIALGSVLAATPASAHGEGETKEGYLLVQQALGHLAHDTGASGIDLAMEKVADALETDDQEGVDVAQLEGGMAALEAGDGVQARTLLQDSINGALESLPPATGVETGTHQVDPALSGRSDLRAQDWALLVASVVVLLLGVWLAFLFRPRDSIRTLRTSLTIAAAHGENGPRPRS